MTDCNGFWGGMIVTGQIIKWARSPFDYLIAVPGCMALAVRVRSPS